MKSYIEKLLISGTERIDSNKVRKLKVSPEFLELTKVDYPWCKTLKEILFCYRHNIQVPPTCICGQATNFFNNSYKTFCGYACANKTLAPSRFEKIKETKKRLYGCETFNNSKRIAVKTHPVILPGKTDETFVPKTLKEKIVTDLLTKNKKLSPWAARAKNENLISEIIETTSFLKVEDSLSARVFCIMNNISSRPKCEMCEKDTKYHRSLQAYAKFCSQKCQCQSPRMKAVQKRNAELLRNKTFHNKTKEVKLRRYGNKNYNNSTKREETCLRKYGHKNPAKNFSIRQKISINSAGTIRKYSMLHHSKRHWTTAQLNHLQHLDLIYQKHVNDQIPITILSEELGFSRSFLHKLFYKKGIQNKIFSGSLCEKQIRSFLKATGEDFVYNTRKVLNKKELDIYVPQKNVAIEINGLFWHSRLHRNYHLEKLKLCQEKGIRLLQFWDTEWSEKQKLCKSMIASAIGKSENKIYARDCEVRFLETREYKSFVSENHIQGYAPCKIKLGLYKHNELVATMSFSKPRFNKKWEWELNRYCNRINHRVVGGASKLLSFFEKQTNPKTLVSYCNLRFFSGELYKKLGFVFEEQTVPAYYYFHKKEYKLQSRVKFQKHKLAAILESTFDSSLSEWNNMKKAGYLRVFDCGQLVFSKTY